MPRTHNMIDAMNGGFTAQKPERAICAWPKKKMKWITSLPESFRRIVAVFGIRPVNRCQSIPIYRNVYTYIYLDPCPYPFSIKYAFVSIAGRLFHSSHTDTRTRTPTTLSTLSLIANRASGSAAWLVLNCFCFLQLNIWANLIRPQCESNRMYTQNDCETVIIIKYDSFGHSNASDEHRIAYCTPQAK